MLYALSYKQCPKCEKRFKTARDTKKHMKACRREGATRVEIKVGGVYPCQICEKNLDTMLTFKRHVFYHHDDDEVEEAYLQSWDKLLGKYFLARERKTIMNRIVKGKWREDILVFMNCVKKFDLTRINLKIPVNNHTPRSEVEKRLAFYRV